MGKDTDGLLNTGQAARKLGVHPGTMVNWRSWGEGPKFIRFGRRIRYKFTDLVEWTKTQANARN